VCGKKLRPTAIKDSGGVIRLFRLLSGPLWENVRAAGLPIPLPPEMS
jgi:hypothetical protein